MIRFGQIEICNVKMTIRNGERFMENFGAPVRFKAFKHLLLADYNGLSRERIFDLIYTDCPDGGPLAGWHMIDVRLWQWRDRIKALDVEIKRQKRGGEMFMRMVPVHVV
jgi:hypothetical protein